LVGPVKKKKSSDLFQEAKIKKRVMRKAISTRDKHGGSNTKSVITKQGKRQGERGRTNFRGEKTKCRVRLRSCTPILAARSAGIEPLGAWHR